MNEYRKTVSHDPSTTYAWVELGPIPGIPDWHIQSKPSSFPFPTNASALMFAAGCRDRSPGREVSVLTIEGDRVWVSGALTTHP